MNIIDFVLSNIPSKSYFYLIYILSIFFFSLFLIYFFSKKAQKNNESKKKLTLSDLIKIAKNEKSSAKDLLFALFYFNDNFKIKSDKKNSMELFRAVLSHKNRNKKMFDYFHENILPKNSEYKDELDKLERSALNKERG